MPPRIYRRCQECNAVQAASEFKRAGGAGVGMERLVSCPSCGHAAVAWAFLAAEKPTGLPEIPHNCVICRDPRRSEMEAARAEGLAYGAIAGRFRVSIDALRHHLERAERPAEGEGGGGALPTEPGTHR